MDAIHNVLLCLLCINQVVITLRFATHLWRLLWSIAVRLASPLSRCAKDSVIQIMRKKRDKVLQPYVTESIATFGFFATIAGVAGVCLLIRYLSPDTCLLSTDPRHKVWNILIEGILYEPTDKRRRRQDHRRSSNVSM